MKPRSQAAPRPKAARRRSRRPRSDYRTAKWRSMRSKGVPKVDAFPDLTFPKLRARQVEERHRGDAGAAARDSGGPGAAPVRRRLRRRSGPQARHVGVHDGDARRRHEGRSIRSRSRGARAARRRDRRGCGLDTRSVSLNTLDVADRPSLALYADIVRNPAFRDDDIARMRGQWLARIAQEKTAADAASRCARCRRCCTATAMRMRFRSPVRAPKPRSTR